MREFTYNLIDDKAIRRKIYILEALNNGERLVAAKELADQLNCSTRTIINDVSQLKSEIPTNWEVISVKSRGYILIKPLTDAILPLINEYVTESVLYKIMLGIFNNKYYTLEKWSQTLYVNKSTLESHTKNYKRVLKKSRLSLNSRFSNLQLKGNEINIRHYYTTFFYLTQRLAEESFLPIELRKKLSSILYRNEVMMDFHLLCTTIFVFTNRFFNKHYVTKEIKFKPIYDEDQSNCFNEMITAIESYYNIKIPKIEKDILDVSLFLASTSRSSQGELIIDYLSESNREIHESYSRLIDMLLTENNLSSGQEWKLKVSLIPHFYKLSIFNELHFSIGYSFDPVSRLNSLLLRKCNENKSLVTNWNRAHNAEKFNSDEIRYIATYATTILNSFAKKINILFLFSGQTVEQKINYTKLTQNLGENVNVHRLINYEFEYDFIISNYKVSNTRAPVIYISGILHENEINAIKKSIFN
ncbi:helix-turn-helix domain-containing protein [Bacillus paramobilis]|uniref:helix-turn-helix domain-containing protein n=1 Tax=Bacillus paramobilis TaxID=2817477 RepID=UPI003D1928EB